MYNNTASDEKAKELANLPQSPTALSLPSSELETGSQHVQLPLSQLELSTFGFAMTMAAVFISFALVGLVYRCAQTFHYSSADARPLGQYNSSNRCAHNDSILRYSGRHWMVYFDIVSVKPRCRTPAGG